MQSYLGSRISTELPRISNSRLSPNTTSPRPPTLATGAHSEATITMYMTLADASYEPNDRQGGGFEPEERGVYAASTHDVLWQSVFLCQARSAAKRRKRRAPAPTDRHRPAWPSPCREAHRPFPDRRKNGAPIGCPNRSCSSFRR